MCLRQVRGYSFCFRRQGFGKWAPARFGNPTFGGILTIKESRPSLCWSQSLISPGKRPACPQHSPRGSRCGVCQTTVTCVLCLSGEPRRAGALRPPHPRLRVGAVKPQAPASSRRTVRPHRRGRGQKTTLSVVVSRAEPSRWSPRDAPFVPGDRRCHLDVRGRNALLFGPENTPWQPERGDQRAPSAGSPEPPLTSSHVNPRARGGRKGPLDPRGSFLGSKLCNAIITLYQRQRLQGKKNPGPETSPQHRRVPGQCASSEH